MIFSVLKASQMRSCAENPALLSKDVTITYTLALLWEWYARGIQDNKSKFWSRLMWKAPHPPRVILGHPLNYNKILSRRFQKYSTTKKLYYVQSGLNEEDLNIHTSSGTDCTANYNPESSCSDVYIPFWYIISSASCILSTLHQTYSRVYPGVLDIGERRHPLLQQRLQYLVTLCE